MATHCDDCRKLEERVRELEAERDRLLRAVHREAEQWDRRAPNTAKDAVQKAS